MKTNRMKINIINYEIGIKEGILTKYANEMASELEKLGHKVNISNKGNKNVDVNHHINYLTYQYVPGTVNTAMVTHFTEGTDEKLKVIKEVMKTCDKGICFSKETKDWLKKKGVGNQEVVHPATTVKRRPRLVAIMTDLYPDGRKREDMFEQLVYSLKDKKKFVFSIIGKGWRPILEELTKDGIQMQWQPEYNQELGQAILSTTDYLLYLGKDEGAISVLDATQAGVRTIAPLVGFHKEIGIDFPFDTQEELNSIFGQLSINPVEDWTWENYAKQHEKIWQKLLS